MTAQVRVVPDTAEVVQLIACLPRQQRQLTALERQCHRVKVPREPSCCPLCIRIGRQA